MLGPLTDPVAHGGDAVDAFHVVCPSLPGYGFSDRPSTRGRGVPWIAEAWATVMTRLGYERFGAQGGDWGSAVTVALGGMYPDRVHGIHVNMPTVPLGPLDDDATERERQTSRTSSGTQRWGTGYQHQQSTRPQTLGYVTRRLTGRPAARGSSRSSGRGPTATATHSASSPETSSSTT